MVAAPCSVAGCDGAYVKAHSVVNADGPATEDYCPRHAVMLGAVPAPVPAAAALPVSNAVFHWLDGNEDIWNRRFPRAFAPELIADLLSGRARAVPRRERAPLEVRACAACGQDMTVISTGQKYHPMCEPEATS